MVDPSGQQVISGARVRVEETVISPKEWQGGSSPRGLAAEKATIIKRYPGAKELPKNFLAFDAVEGGQRTPVFAGQEKGPLRTGEIIEGGKAISIKSVNLSDPGYKTAEGTFNNLKGYINDIVKFPKSGYALSGRDPVTGQLHQVRMVNPSERVMHIELSEIPTEAQMAGLSRVRFEAAESGIQVVIISPQ